VRQNLERLKFGTRSAQSVALCDVRATLIHRPLRTCAKPKSTFVTTLNSPCILWLKNGLICFGFYLGIPHECPNLVNNIFCTPFQSLSFLSRFSVASITIKFNTWKYAVWALIREVWLVKTLAKTHLLLPS
jgi:hypothetical protein